MSNVFVHLLFIGVIVGLSIGVLNTSKKSGVSAGFYLSVSLLPMFLYHGSGHLAAAWGLSVTFLLVQLWSRQALILSAVTALVVVLSLFSNITFIFQVLSLVLLLVFLKPMLGNKIKFSFSAWIMTFSIMGCYFILLVAETPVVYIACLVPIVVARKCTLWTTFNLALLVVLSTFI